MEDKNVIKKGEVVPDINLKDQNEQEIKISEYKGKKVSEILRQPKQLSKYRGKVHVIYYNSNGIPDAPTEEMLFSTGYLRDVIESIKVEAPFRCEVFVDLIFWSNNFNTDARLRIVLDGYDENYDSNYFVLSLDSHVSKMMKEFPGTIDVRAKVIDGFRELCKLAQRKMRHNSERYLSKYLKEYSIAKDLERCSLKL